MKIWVDADACPRAVTEIIITAAIKRQTPVLFVANKPLPLPTSPLITLIQVEKGADVADLYIAERAEECDLIITQDIPLANTVVTKGIVAIDPRGHTYTVDNIGQRLSTRNLMQELRDGGAITGGPKQYSEKEKRAFAACFDRELTKLLKNKKS